MTPPVIAIDGPAASGKGTVAQGVAAALRLHYLDSGSLYRLVALKASGEGIAVNDEARLAALAQSLEVAFDKRRIRLEGLDVTEELRGEARSNRGRGPQNLRYGERRGAGRTPL